MPAPVRRRVLGGVELEGLRKETRASIASGRVVADDGIMRGAGSGAV